MLTNTFTAKSKTYREVAEDKQPLAWADDNTVALMAWDDDGGATASVSKPAVSQRTPVEVPGAASNQ